MKDLLFSFVKNEKIRKHCIATAAIMKGIARLLKEDEGKFWKAGLLHDIDYELTKDKIEEHGVKAGEILKGKVEDEIIEAIKEHNYLLGMPKTKLGKALVLADQLSGLIVACALVMPNKSLEEVRIETIAKKFKQKDFARKVRRDLILKMLDELNLKASDVFKAALDEMLKVKDELGL